MKTKILALAFMAITVGMFTLTRTKNAVPSDLRDAMSDRAVDQLGSDLSAAKIPNAGSPREVSGVNSKVELPASFYRNKVVAALVAERMLATNAVYALTHFPRGGGNEIRAGAEKYQRVSRGASGVVAPIKEDVVRGLFLGNQIISAFGSENDEFLKYVSSVTNMTFSASPRCMSLTPREYESELSKLQQEYAKADGAQQRLMLLELESAGRWPPFEKIASGS